jgi:glutamate-1-semialdehyde 2,1-aminomutase
MTWTNKNDLELRARAEKVIPGGMYGHESTMLMPKDCPQFFSRSKGARLWDTDGNEYIDYMCAYGPNLLGYGFEPVDRAAAAQQALGDVMTGPSDVMVDLAEAFVGMVSHADWAMFCKNGTDATSMAMVTARAHTGRKTILCAKGAYHGAAAWCTPRPAGVLPADRAHIAYYDYNDADSLADAFKAHENDVAAVFATPFRHEVFEDQADPTQEYALAARGLCDQTGALLIVDDVRAGFRLARDCSWAAIGVKPDLSTWGKCFANGYPISALLGADVARQAASEIFVTGSFWFSAVPMAAAIETLRQIRETDYLERIISAGQSLRDGLQQQAASHGYTLRQSGPVQMPQIFFEDDPDFRIGYGWTTECLKRGVYVSPYHNMFLSSAHTQADIAATLKATDEAFGELKRIQATLEPHPILLQLMADH